MMSRRSVCEDPIGFYEHARHGNISVYEARGCAARTLPPATTGTTYCRSASRRSLGSAEGSVLGRSSSQCWTNVSNHAGFVGS